MAKKFLDGSGTEHLIGKVKSAISTMKKETINISLSVSSGGLASDIISTSITIRNREKTSEILYSGTWQGSTITVNLTAEYHYEIIFGTVTGYQTPVSDKYNAVFGNVRNVNVQYVYLSDAVDTFYIDDTIDNPATKISGQVNGVVIQWIYAHTHRYLMKKTGDGKAAICQLSDNDSNLFFDGQTTAYLNGNYGDVIRKLPPFYWSCTEISTHKFEVMLSLTNATGTMKLWDTNQVLSVYEACAINGRLYSRSGVQSAGSLSQSTMKSYARARGTGYTLEKWCQHNIEALLFYAKHGNTNSQGINGSGTNDYQKATGQTDSLGMEDTVNGGNGSTGSINNLGCENRWGNKAEWIDNVVVDYDAGGNIFKITEDDGTVRNVVSCVGANAHTWPTKMILGENFDLIPAPDNVVGGDSKGYCDSVYLSTSSSRVVYVSLSYAYSNGGVAYASAVYDASDTDANIGGRLAFKGEITEFNDVQAFIELSEVA